jgi:hypothetical protein
MDLIARRDFLTLINRSEHALASIRRRREIMLWNDPLKSTTMSTPTIAYDAALWLSAFLIVSQGPSWEGVRLALPGLQYTLRASVDRPDTFAAITIASPTEMIVGAGTFDELVADRVIGLPNHTFLAPLPPVVDLMRRRAAEAGIILPAKLAPPLLDAPIWARGDPAWEDPHAAHGVRTVWQPSGAFALATLH